MYTTSYPGDSSEGNRAHPIQGFDFKTSALACVVALNQVAEDALRSVLEQKHLVDRRLAAAKADQASLQKQLHNKTRLTQQMEAMLEELESEHTISQPVGLFAVIHRKGCLLCASSFARRCCALDAKQSSVFQMHSQHP